MPSDHSLKTSRATVRRGVGRARRRAGKGEGERDGAVQRPVGMRAERQPAAGGVGQERLLAGEQIYRAIGESIDYGVWVCAPDGRNIYASDSFLRLVGMTQKECSDFGWGRVLHPEDAERTIALWKRCVRTGGRWDMVHRFRGVDGAYHAILARGVPVRDEGGQVLYWAGINLDITALKNAQEALRVSEERLRQLNTELERRVNERTAQLQALAAELTRSEERERRRIAQILHDHLQQLLVAARLHLDGLEIGRGGQNHRVLRKVSRLLRECTAVARGLSHELSPPILNESGLADALRWLAAWMSDRHGLRVQVSARHRRYPLSDEVRLLLFCAAREALFNVVKHSGVTGAVVRMTSPGGVTLKLEVIDHGRGFDVGRVRGPQIRSGVGLASIAERLRIFGGDLRIASQPGRGTRVWMTIPLGSVEEGSVVQSGMGGAGDGVAATAAEGRRRVKKQL